MGKRLFIGIKASQALQDQFLRWQGSLPIQFPLRWIEPDNLHITLIPPWEDKKWQGICPRLEDISKRSSAFNLQFTDIALGPNPKKPHLLWTKITPNPELTVLRNQLFATLWHQPSTEKFFPHLTLARFSFEKVGSIPLPQITVDWTEKVSSFTLFESHLRPQGATYEVLETFPF